MEPSRNTYIAFSTICIQFLVHRNHTLLGFRTYETRCKSQVSVDLDGISLCIWSTEADLGSGDSEVNRKLPVSLHSPESPPTSPHMPDFPSMTPSPPPDLSDPTCLKWVGFKDTYSQF